MWSSCAFFPVKPENALPLFFITHEIAFGSWRRCYLLCWVHWMEDGSGCWRTTSWAALNQFWALEGRLGGVSWNTTANECEHFRSTLGCTECGVWSLAEGHPRIFITQGKSTANSLCKMFLWEIIAAFKGYLSSAFWCFFRELMTWKPVLVFIISVVVRSLESSPPFTDIPKIPLF